MTRAGVDSQYQRSLRRAEDVLTSLRVQRRSLAFLPGWSPARRPRAAPATQRPSGPCPSRRSKALPWRMQVDSTPKAISSTTPPSSTTSPSAASSGPVPPLTPTTSWTERALYVAREALRPALLIESITFHDATRTLRIQLSTQATADDCETVARAIQNDEGVDLPHRIPDDVVLEVTTPGVSETLTASHEFAAFKSFPVTVTLHEAHRKHGKQVQGTLMGRNDTHVSVNLHGRIVKLARGNVAEVRLQPATDGDEEESA